MRRKNGDIDKAFTDRAWANMKSLLDREMPTADTSRKPLFWWIFGALATGLVVGGLGVWYFEGESTLRSNPINLPEPVEHPALPLDAQPNGPTAPPTAAATAFFEGKNVESGIEPADRAEHGASSPTPSTAAATVFSEGKNVESGIEPAEKAELGASSPTPSTAAATAFSEGKNVGSEIEPAGRSEHGASSPTPSTAAATVFSEGKNVGSEIEPAGRSEHGASSPTPSTAAATVFSEGKNVESGIEPAGRQADMTMVQPVRPMLQPFGIGSGDVPLVPAESKFPSANYSTVCFSTLKNAPGEGYGIAAGFQRHYPWGRSRWTLSLGARYTYIRRPLYIQRIDTIDFSNPDEQIDSTRFGFEAFVQSVVELSSAVVKTDLKEDISMHYLELPLSVSRSFNGRFGVLAGASPSALLTATPDLTSGGLFNSLGRSNKDSDITPDVLSENTDAVLVPVSGFDLKVNAGVYYRMSPTWHVVLSGEHSLVDVLKDNATKEYHRQLRLAVCYRPSGN